MRTARVPETLVGLPAPRTPEHVCSHLCGPTLQGLAGGQLRLSPRSWKLGTGGWGGDLSLKTLLCLVRLFWVRSKHR